MKADITCTNDSAMSASCVDTGAFLETVIRDKLGDDLARTFRRYADRLKEDRYEKHGAPTDPATDEYRAACRKAAGIFRDISDLLTAPHLNREALQRAAFAGYDALKNL